MKIDWDRMKRNFLQVHGSALGISYWYGFTDSCKGRTRKGNKCCMHYSISFIIGTTIIWVIVFVLWHNFHLALPTNVSEKSRHNKHINTDLSLALISTHSSLISHFHYWFFHWVSPNVLAGPIGLFLNLLAHPVPLENKSTLLIGIKFSNGTYVKSLLCWDIAG